MSDNWEMCYIHADFIAFHTPQKSEVVHAKEFIKMHQEKIIGGNDIQKLSCLLLLDGWEPYAVSDNDRYFRRKFQG